eukprot:5890069-Prymnesium_polylepis.1
MGCHPAASSPAWRAATVGTSGRAGASDGRAAGAAPRGRAANYCITCLSGFKHKSGTTSFNR